MDMNRQRLKIPQRGMLVQGVEGQDAIVSVGAIAVNQCDLKLPQVIPSQVGLNVTAYLAEGFGAICLGEH
jgi:hypothetical protein